MAELVKSLWDRKVFAVHTIYREKELIKQVPGAKYDTKHSHWTIPATHVSCKQLINVFGESLTKIDPDVVTFIGRQEAKIEMLDCIRTGTLQCRPVPGLTDLQARGAHFLVEAQTALLGDEMGSGKTVQACAAMQMIAEGKKHFHGIVICPNSIKQSVWAEHIAEWTTLNPYVVQGSAVKRRKTITEALEDKFSVLIINWEGVKGHSKLAPYGSVRMTDKDREPKELNDFAFDVAILDEAHKIKNPKAQQTRAVWAIEARYRWALTGTPIANHPGDLWSILRFLDGESWPAKTKFVDRYCLLAYSHFGGMDIIGLNPETADEFHYLFSRYFLRRLKSEIMDRTITKNAERRLVELSPKHRKMYNEFKTEMIAQLDDGTIMETEVLTHLLRMVQLSSAMLDEDKRMVPGTSPKVAELKDLVRDMEGEPLVVYSASKQLAVMAHDELTEAGVSCALLTGDVPANLRSYLIDDFQEGRVQVFIATTGAAAEGITLTRASVLVFLQRDWSMVKNSQAEDRIHRWGQMADEVTIIDILTADTVDEHVYNVALRKKGRMEEVVRDKERLKEML